MSQSLTECEDASHWRETCSLHTALPPPPPRTPPPPPAGQALTCWGGAGGLHSRILPRSRAATLGRNPYLEKTGKVQNGCYQMNDRKHILVPVYIRRKEIISLKGGRCGRPPESASDFTAPFRAKVKIQLGRC